MDAEELDGLAMAAQGGDREAFHALFLATQRELRIAIIAHARSREQADEVLQATYVTACERLAQYRPTRTLRAWLATIARNRLVDEWRRNRHLATLEAAPLSALIAAEQVDALEAAETAAIRADTLTRLSQCLERLPAQARSLVEERHRHGRSLADLARRFHRTTENLSVALCRIRQSLRRCVEGGA